MPAASKPTSRRAALRRVLTAIAAKAVSPADAGGVVYGVIVIGALLAAESGSHDGYAGVLESGLVAACLYWVAHAYAKASEWMAAAITAIKPGVSTDEVARPGW